MFTMMPSLSFGRRLSLWWSCVWRQSLCMLFVWLVVAAIVFGAYLAGRYGHPNFVSQAMFSAASSREYDMLSLWLLLVNVMCLPIIGYMTRRGFAAQRLAVPTQYSLQQASMLGLTTWGWAIVVTLVSNVVAIALRLAVSGLFGSTSIGGGLFLLILVMVLNLFGTLYIVIPRQARRLRVQAGELQPG